MSGSKRPSTSSLRRFLVSRPYIPVAEIRRRFGLGDPDEMSRIERNGQCCFVGLPEREAMKVQDLWMRDEVGLELSVEVRAPVVVGIYPMRIARYVIENGHVPMNGHATIGPHSNGHAPVAEPRGSPPPPTGTAHEVAVSSWVAASTSFSDPQRR
jgi:hypothetical protein